MNTPLFTWKECIEDSPFRCNTCGAHCTKCFLRCVECNMNLHVKCIPALPDTGRRRTHGHLLALIDPLPEDDSNEYYCDACEEERNPKHSVDYCAECEFVAHIECGISEVILSKDEESSVACRIMDAGFCMSDDEAAINVSEEEETDDEEGDDEKAAEEEELDFNISGLFDERVSKDLNKKGREYEEEVSDISKPLDEQMTRQKLEEKAAGEEQADQDTCAVTKEEEEANQETDVSTDLSPLEKEIDEAREEIKAPTCRV